ncbi:unnamed protein product [Prunus armeniaca]
MKVELVVVVVMVVGMVAVEVVVVVVLVVEVVVDVEVLEEMVVVVEEVVVVVVVVKDEEEEDVVVVVAVVDIVNVVVQVMELAKEVEVVSFFKMNYGILGIKKYIKGSSLLILKVALKSKPEPAFKCCCQKATAFKIIESFVFDITIQPLKEKLLKGDFQNSQQAHRDKFKPRN